MSALWEAYMEIPPVTRVYTTACMLTTLLLQMDIVSPYSLYFHPRPVFYHFQLWRIITSFTFVAQQFSINFLLNMIFTYRYSRLLEETHYHNRTADYVMVFLFGGILTLICGCFTTLMFTGHAFTSMLIYIWSRRNPLLRLSFFGIVTFTAPWLPWVLLGLTMLLGGNLAVDIVGIFVGHSYYYLEDVFPNQPGGFHILKTPQILKDILDGNEEGPQIIIEDDTIQAGGAGLFRENVVIDP